MKELSEREMIANTILRQLSPQGLRGLRLMLGADRFAVQESGVSFRFKGARECNHVQVELTPADNYRLTLRRIRGTEVRVVAEHCNVHDDQLRRLFQAETGLETRVPVIAQAPRSQTGEADQAAE